MSNSKNNINDGKPNIVVSETESPDPTVVLDITRDGKEEISKKFVKNKIGADVGVEEILDEVDPFNTNEINEKYSENHTFITLTIFDTHFGKRNTVEVEHQEPHHGEQWPQGGYYEEAIYSPESRNRFLRIVFLIVLSLLTITGVVIGYVITNHRARSYFIRNWQFFFILGTVLLMAALYSEMCSPCMITSPCNILLLALSVAGYTILATNLSVHFRTEIVLYATMATAAVVLVCLLLACTSYDFTKWFLYVIAIATVFCVISLIIFVVGLITHHYPEPLYIAKLIIGGLIQVVMLIIELQMIIGGKSLELDDDQYVLAAFMLYTSILSIFMDALRLTGYASN